MARPASDDAFPPHRPRGMQSTREEIREGIHLSHTNDWLLEDAQRDLRGYTAYDADGRRIGHVEDLLVDPDSQRIRAVRLDDGQEADIEHLHVGDDAVYVDEMNRARVPSSYQRAEADYAAVRPNEPDFDAEYGGYEPHFRQRHPGLYPDADFEQYEQAYRYGYEAGRQPRYRETTFDEVEGELQGDYGGTPAWNDAREGVRYGYQTGRNHHTQYDHHRRTHGEEDYEHHAEGYRFGAIAGRDQRYAGRTFDEVEGELEDDYESNFRHGDDAGWDQAREAVRHGFERVRFGREVRGASATL